MNVHDPNRPELERRLHGNEAFIHSIVGIDCATQPENVGLALTHIEGDLLVIEEVTVGSQRSDPASVISAWLSTRERVLLALDAPLGWPTALGHSLSKHRAGQGVGALPNDLFRRQTDTEIYERLQKRPLEVGANLIARTAHAALTLLADLRSRTGREIPLAWNSSASTVTAAIEVYPAATLAARNMVNGPRCLEPLSSELQLPLTPLLASSPHARDAVICAMAGVDFLADRCVPPTDLQVAQKEGWIWARRSLAELPA